MNPHLDLLEAGLRDDGVFDERYFMCAEEMDLQYRTRKAGYARVVIAGPENVHHLSQSLNRAEIAGCRCRPT
jgi:GT2 family glycosyltransferase